jgi:hypothetical protein
MADSATTPLRAHLMNPAHPTHMLMSAPIESPRSRLQSAATSTEDFVSQHPALRYLIAAALAVIVCLQPAPSDAAANAVEAAPATIAAVDLPLCVDVAAQVGNAKQIRIGLADPVAAPALALHLTAMGQYYDDVTPCAERWSSVLPLATPLAKVSTLEKHYGWGVYAAALFITLILCAVFTPKSWWRRPTALAIITLVGGTWLSATAILGAANALKLPQRAFYENAVSLQLGAKRETWHEVTGVRGLDQWLAGAGFDASFSSAKLNLRALDGGNGTVYDTPTAGNGKPGSGALTTTGRTAKGNDGRLMLEVLTPSGTSLWMIAADSIATPAPGKAGDVYRVHQALNLRTGVGVDHSRITTLARGATVTLTGERNADWWEVKSGGQTGWVSSLWLRRVVE